MNAYDKSQKKGLFHLVGTEKASRVFDMQHIGKRFVRVKGHRGRDIDVLATKEAIIEHDLWYGKVVYHNGQRMNVREVYKYADTGPTGTRVTGWIAGEPADVLLSQISAK